jgi:rhodanese-related sulfurtransferase
MIVRVDALEAQERLAAGILVLDTLPQSIYQQEHLPGARSVPLETFEPAQVEQFDRSAGVLVYCFDQHCDLSARTARRLDDLGFDPVYDLIGGRAAWTALGLPTEGMVGDRRRISHYVDVVPTVSPDDTIADVRALGESRFPVPVVDQDGVLFGTVHPTAAGLPPSTAVRDVMVPAPGTIRPELRVDEVAEQLARDGLSHIFVTAVNGVLIGRVVTAELHV